jgi:undecaprenyl-diphosphatase
VTLVESLVLGLVQGLTEFVPISSSAHLILVPKALGWEAPPLAYDVSLHIASLLAVLFYFRRELIRMLVELFQSGPGRRLVVMLVVATIPAVIIGSFFNEPITKLFGEPRVAAAFLIGTAAVLTAAETVARRRDQESVNNDDTVEVLASNVGLGRAIAIGSGQALAILPGLSRSGLTIGTGLFTGLARPNAAKFSFLLSIPALAGAGVLELPKLSQFDIGLPALAVGFVASLAASYFAVAAMIGYLQRRGLYPFAVYCLIVGVLGVVLLR